MFKSKEFKIVTTMVFILLTIALCMKFYMYNRIEYSNHIVKELTKENKELICINKETNEAYKTENTKYELLSVKTSCFNKLYNYKIYFNDKNKAFDILDCNIYKKNNSK